MHENSQPRLNQLIDRYLAAREGKVRRGTAAPLTGAERAAAVDVVKWFLEMYHLSPITGGLTAKQKEMIP